MSAFALLGLTLRARRRRLLVLGAFALLFLAAAVAARVLVSDADGHVDPDRLFMVGGYPLVSAMLLFGWLLGRFPLIATLVLMAGLASDDRRDGLARLYAVRPVSPLAVYGVRAVTLGAVAFLFCGALLPLFDLILIGTWAGPATLVLVASYVLVYGGLTALLSVWSRGDAWLALLCAIASMVWDALRRADMLTVPPGTRDLVTFVLPPQAALFELEGAFGSLQPIPWDAFLYVAAYGLVMFALAGLSLAKRDLA